MFASILLLVIPLFINIGFCGYCIYTAFPSVSPVLIVVTAIVIIFTALGFIGFFKSGKKIFTLLPWLATLMLAYIFRNNIAVCIDYLTNTIANVSEVENIIS